MEFSQPKSGYLDESSYNLNEVLTSIPLCVMYYTSGEWMLHVERPGGALNSHVTWQGTCTAYPAGSNACGQDVRPMGVGDPG